MSEATRLRESLERIKSELGVPDGNYPAPVANAWHIADSALQGHSYRSEQVEWDPADHEHIQGFFPHSHPHPAETHMNFNGLVGKGENTGNTFVSGAGIDPAIVGEPPESKTS